MKGDRRRVLSVLEAGIDELDREGIIDPGTEVGITGMSDGAETANFALVNAPERFAAAAVSSDWCNPLIYYLLGPKYQEVLRRTLHLEDPNAACVRGEAATDVGFSQCEQGADAAVNSGG